MMNIRTMRNTQIVLTGLLVVVAGPWLVSGQSSQRRSPLCCMADQWTIKQSHSYLKIHRGQFQHGEVLANWTYDAVKQREVYVTTRSDHLGPQQQLVYYLLFQENMMYVYNNLTAMCIKHTLNKPFYKRCIPPSATVVDANMTLGGGVGVGEGVGSINATRVKFDYPLRHGSRLFMTLTVTQSCVPVMETFTLFPWGADGMEREMVEYTDMKIGPVPDSLFELPHACCKATFARPQQYPSISFDF